jgi:hypothetical protein
LLSFQSFFLLLIIQSSLPSKMTGQYNLYAFTFHFIAMILLYVLYNLNMLYCLFINNLLSNS